MFCRIFVLRAQPRGQAEAAEPAAADIDQISSSAHLVYLKESVHAKLMVFGVLCRFVDLGSMKNPIHGLTRQSCRLRIESCWLCTENWLKLKCLSKVRRKVTALSGG